MKNNNLSKTISYTSFGNKAILLEWQPIIDEAILKEIINFRDKIGGQKNDVYADFIVGYNSLTIVFKEFIVDFKEEIKKLQDIYSSNIQILKTQNYLWEIPVCYDLEFGIDLKEISESINLEVPEIVRLHSESVYTVFFIGFLPGFLYLGGLETTLFFDRKPNPRLVVEKGSVGIGGEQTGVYPISSAGGWNIIGKSPINFFDVDNEYPCFAKSGDQIKFKPISKNEFYQLEKVVSDNNYQLYKTIIHD